MPFNNTYFIARLHYVTRVKKVKTFFFWQSNEVKSSVHMEKEGLVRSVGRIKSEKLNIGELITDRHVQITKYIREEMPNTSHFFDVWHVAKGIIYTHELYFGFVILIIL